jgi:ACDE family multidrug resistance protein
MKSKMRMQFAWLCGVPFILVLSNSMIIPALPLIQSALKLTPFQVGLLVTAFSVPAGVFIPIAGYLSDQFGRKTIMVPSLFLFAIGGAMVGIAAWLLDNPFMWMIAARILQGIGGGGTYQLAMALTGDIFQTSERAKALGLLESANGLGKVISPIIGSLTAAIIWFAPFFVYPLLTIPVAIGVWETVREPFDEDRRQPLRQYVRAVGRAVSRNPLSLAAAYVAGALVLFMLFGVLSYISDVLEDNYGIEGAIKGFVIAIPVLAMAVTSYFSGRWLQKQAGKVCKWASVIGMSLVAGGLVLAAFTDNVYVLMASVSAQGIGSGLALPAINLLITGAAAEEERGMITGLYGTMRFFGAAFGPPIFGALVVTNKILLFVTAAGIVVAAAIFGYTCIKAPKLPGSEGGDPSGKREKKRQTDDARPRAPLPGRRVPLR